MNCSQHCIAQALLKSLLSFHNLSYLRFLNLALKWVKWIHPYIFVRKFWLIFQKPIKFNFFLTPLILSTLCFSLYSIMISFSGFSSLQHRCTRAEEFSLFALWAFILHFSKDFIRISMQFSVLNAFWIILFCAPKTAYHEWFYLHQD